MLCSIVDVETSFICLFVKPNSPDNFVVVQEVFGDKSDTFIVSYQFCYQLFFNTDVNHYPKFYIRRNLLFGRLLSRLTVS